MGAKLKAILNGRRVELQPLTPFVPPVDLLLAGVPVELHDQVEALAAAGPVCGIQITDPADPSSWKVCVAKEATGKQRRDLAKVLGVSVAAADLVDIASAGDRADEKEP